VVTQQKRDVFALASFVLLDPLMSTNKSSTTPAPKADSKNDTFALKRETVRSMVVKSSVRTGDMCTTGSKQHCHSGP
jgi:hypothetical protein